MHVKCTSCVKLCTIYICPYFNMSYILVLVLKCESRILYIFFVIDNLTFVRHEAVCGCMWVCGCVAVCGCVGVADRLLGIAIFFCNMCGLRRVCQSGCVCVRASVNMPDRVYLCPSVCSEEKPTQLTNPPKEMSRFSALIFSSKTTFTVY